MYVLYVHMYGGKRLMPRTELFPWNGNIPEYRWLQTIPYVRLSGAEATPVSLLPSSYRTVRHGK